MMIKEIGIVPTILIKLGYHRQFFIRLLITIGLLLFTAVVSFVLGVQDLMYGIILAALPFIVAFIFIILGKLHLSPIFILLAAAYIPFSLPTGTGSRLVTSLILSIAFIFLWLFRMIVIDKRIRLVKTPANVAIIGFSAVVVISLVWSMIFRDPLLFVPESFIFVQIASAVIMIVSPGIMLLMANLVHEEKYLKVMAWVMISLGLIGIIRNLLSIQLPANTEGLASMWVVGLCISFALFDQKLPKPIRGSLLILALMWVYWGFVRNLSWVAGWLPVFVSGFFIVLIRSKRLLLLGLLVVALYIFTHMHILEMWLGQETVISGNTRLLAWQMNMRFTSQHLLFGMGPAGYAVYYMTYYPTDAMATHSNYIDLISQTGIIGTIFYMSIFVVLIWRGLVVYQRVKGRRDFIEGLTVAALSGTFGCLVIMAFGDWLLPFAYTQTIAGFDYTIYSWLFMGTILSLDTLTTKKMVKVVENAIN